jgi:hypothetical protein
MRYGDREMYGRTFDQVGVLVAQPPCDSDRALARRRHDAFHLNDIGLT